MSDLSIKNFLKIPTSEQQFVLDMDNVSVYEKYDGVRVYLIKRTRRWDVVYKGNIIYEHEFDSYPVDVMKYDSIGSSQFSQIFRYLPAVSNTAIPNNTVIQVEFVLKKPTLTRDYVLDDTNLPVFFIGYRPCISIKSEYGKSIVEYPDLSIVHNTEVVQRFYAKELGMHLPRCLLYKERLSNHFKKTSTEEIVEEMTDYFLSIPSELSSTDHKVPMEGVVIKAGTRLYKIVQPDQYSEEVRTAKKHKYRMGIKEEHEYWRDVYQYSLNVVSDFMHTTKSFNDISRIHLDVPEIAKYISVEDLPEHSKKNVRMVFDDVQLTAKTLYLKSLKGNNGVLFPGRFQPPTKAHQRIVNKALETFDFVVINIIYSKQTESSPFAPDIIEDLWEQTICNTNKNRVFIQHTKTGNIQAMINKVSTRNINAVICGSDRYEAYYNQTLKLLGVDVIGIDRNYNEDISGTRLREALKNNLPGLFESLSAEYDPHLKNRVFNQLSYEINNLKA